MTSEPTPATHERIAGAFLLVVMTVGCFAFWIGIPWVTMWALGQVTDSKTVHFLSALVAVPALMLLAATGLFWLNGLYLRVTGVLRRLEADEDEAEWRRRLRGPLEPLLLASLAIELVALFVWFFFIAENPSAQVI